MELINVRERGVVADGVTLVSTDVQGLVDELASRGGGTLYFPAGEYVLATVFLRSNIRVEFEKGVKILGALNFRDFCPHEEPEYPLYQDGSHSYFNPSMFVAIDCENVAIVGPGLIDMRSVWSPEDLNSCAFRAAKPIVPPFESTKLWS